MTLALTVIVLVAAAFALAIGALYLWSEIVLPRCPQCKGVGKIYIYHHSDEQIAIECPHCKGRRFLFGRRR